MKSKKTWLLSLVVMLVFMASVAQGQSIKIGLMAPLTGPRGLGRTQRETVRGNGRGGYQ